MSHNERKPVPVPSMELKPTSQAVRTNKQKSGKNPILHRPSFSFSSFSPSLFASAMGVWLRGCILQSCVRLSVLTRAACDLSPSMRNLHENKAIPELLFLLTFCTKFFGDKWHDEGTDCRWKLWLYITERGGLEEGTSLGSRCQEIFDNLLQLPGHLLTHDAHSFALSILLEKA